MSPVTEFCRLISVLRLPDTGTLPSPPHVPFRPGVFVRSRINALDGGVLICTIAQMSDQFWFQLESGQ